MVGPGTIREATAADLPAIDELMRAQASGSTRELCDRERGRCHLLVLDAPDGGIAAAALVHIAGTRGHLTMLVVASRFEGEGLEDRMIGVAEALCSAFGADTLDIPARPAA
jgi:N-acetylglutamate synthase-like GNAT family acetyltransferase